MLDDDFPTIQIDYIQGTCTCNTDGLINLKYENSVKSF